MKKFLIIIVLFCLGLFVANNTYAEKTCLTVTVDIDWMGSMYSGSATFCWEVTLIGGSIDEEGELLLTPVFYQARANALKNFGISHTKSSDKIILKEDVIISGSSLNHLNDIMLLKGELIRSGNGFKVKVIELNN